MYEYSLHYVNLEREQCRLSLAYPNLSQPTAQSATSFAIAISADVEDSFNAATPPIRSMSQYWTVPTRLPLRQ